MSRKFRVFATSTATALLTVEVTDEDLAKLAADLEMDVINLTDDDIKDFADEKAHTEGFLTICAQCSGWGQDGSSLDVGDDWETDEVEEVK